MRARAIAYPSEREFETSKKQIMRLTLILFACLLATLARSDSPMEEMHKCDNTREAIEQCAAYLFDTNYDGRITVEELDTVIPNLVSVPMHEGFNSTLFLRCDIDEDGVLTHEDWVHPNATVCLPTTNMLYIACMVCIRNGFVMDHADAHKKRGTVPYDYEGVVRAARENAEKIRELQQKEKERVAKFIKERLEQKAKQEAGGEKTNEQAETPQSPT